MAKIVARAATRRAALRALLGGAGANVLLLTGMSQTELPSVGAKKKKKGCNGDGQCKKSKNPCKKAVCKRGRCRKKNEPDGKSCGADRVCSNGKCVAGCGSTGAACTAGDECCSAVCACGDPTGWATKPDDDTCWPDSYSQGFEENLDGWFDFRNQFDPNNDPPNRVFPPQETIERVCGTQNGISAKSGDCFAKVLAGNAYPPVEDLTALSTLGGFSDDFPNGGFQVSIDIYLDPADTADGERFAYTVALNQSNCEWGGDFIFHAGKVGEDYCIRGGTDLDTLNGPAPCTTVQGNEPIEITAEGWYTFVHEFVQVGGVVGADMHVLDPEGGEIGTWLPDPVVPNADGGNRYGWFPWNDFEFLAIDNVSRSS